MQRLTCSRTNRTLGAVRRRRACQSDPATFTIDRPTGTTGTTGTTATGASLLDDATPLGPFLAGTVARPRPATLNQRGQRLRFAVVSSTGGNVGAVDIQVNAPV